LVYILEYLYNILKLDLNNTTIIIITKKTDPEGIMNEVVKAINNLKMVNTIIILPNFPFIMFYYFINQTKMVKLIYSPPTPHPIINLFLLPFTVTVLSILFPQFHRSQNTNTAISSSNP
jgi:hypothetical protein